MTRPHRVGKPDEATEQGSVEALRVLDSKLFVKADHLSFDRDVPQKWSVTA